MQSLTIHALIIVCRCHVCTAQSSQREDCENHHSIRRIEGHPARPKAPPLFAQSIGGSQTGRRIAGDVGAIAGAHLPSIYFLPYSRVVRGNIPRPFGKLTMQTLRQEQKNQSTATSIEHFILTLSSCSLGYEKPASRKTI